MNDDERTVVARQSGRVTVGTRLNGIYQVDGLIGVGGMSEIYKGHNIQTQDHVAIKVVLPEFANDEQMVSLFRREALVLNRLSHEAIVRYHVFSHDISADLLYLAMEFVEGPTLRERIKQRPLLQLEACQLVSKVAMGMRAAHQESVVHRDLATDNVILAGGDVSRPKIIDFGIARASEATDSTLMQSGFAGKYNYVSPEQIGLFGGVIGPASDIYSLGLVFAAALLGKPLDMGGSHAQVVAKRQAVPDLSGINPGVKPLIERMLQPNPANRPQSMDEVIAALSPMIGRQRDATNTGRRESLPGMPAEPVVRRETRRSASGVFAGAFLLLALGGAGWWATQNTDAGRNLLALVLETPAEDKPVSTTPSGKSELKVGPDGELIAGTKPAGGEPQSTPQPTDAVPSAEPGMAAQPEPGATPETAAQPETQAGGESESPAAGAPQPPGEARISLDEEGRQEPADMTVNPPQTAKLEESDGGGARSEGSMGAEVSKTDLAAWVANFNGGNCFMARSLSVASNSASIEGFGLTVEPFENLEKDFRSRFGIEPLIGMRTLSEPQCPVVEFVRSAATPSMSVMLTDDVLTPREQLVAKISDITLRHLGLFVTTPEGALINVTGRAKKEGNGVALTIPAGDFAAGGNGYLLWALASDIPLRVLDLERAKSVAEFVKEVRGEAAKRNATISTALKYFRRS